MNLSDLSPKQQETLFIFDRWASHDTGDGPVIIYGLTSQGELRPLFALPTVTVPEEDSVLSMVEVDALSASTISVKPSPIQPKPPIIVK